MERTSVRVDPVMPSASVADREVWLTRREWQVLPALLLPDVHAEFAATRDPELIRACTDEMLAEFDDAPVRHCAIPADHPNELTL